MKRKRIAELNHAVNIIMAHALVNAPARRVAAFVDGGMDGACARVDCGEYSGMDRVWFELGYGLGIARHAAHALNESKREPPYHPRTPPRP